MQFLRNLSRGRILFTLLCVPLLLLAACGSNAGSGVGTGTGNSKTTGGSGANGNVTLTVGSKLDIESQIIAKLYSLTLQKQGFKVTEKFAFGNSTFTFKGIQSGALDLYPEFTATGLDALSKKSSLNDQQDYDTVKSGFKSQFNIDWLDYSPLNDTYALCMQQDEAKSLGITSISDLAKQAKKVAIYFPSDSADALTYLQPKYNLSQSSFQAVNKVDISIVFKEIAANNQPRVGICYSTDQHIATDKLVVLQDDQHAFPAYHPAPIVRDSVLSKSPDIATALNKLAPIITTDASIQLQNNVNDLVQQGASQSQAITKAATDYLNSKGM